MEASERLSVASRARPPVRQFVPLLVLILLVAACGGLDPAPGPSGPHVDPSAPTTAGPEGQTPASRPPASRPPASPPVPSLLLSDPPPPPTAAPRTAVPTQPPEPIAPTLAEMVGQKLVIRMEGTTASPDLLGRIRRGEIGGVILFGANVTTATALSELTLQLQEAAAAGGRPPLVIVTDQEGGAINRIPWAPPTLSAPQMGSDDSAIEASTQGAAAGAALRSLGINVDLAPVADVPGTVESFLYLQGRTWSFNADTTSMLVNAFAAGLESAGVDPTMKHFPGIGLAVENTDAHLVTLDASTSALAPGLEPYRLAIAQRIPIIMFSNAIYSAYDPSDGAGWSATVADSLLRHDLGFTGVTITDSLTGTAAAQGVAQDQLALRAAAVGTDLILVTGNEASTRTVYATLLAAATNGLLPRPVLEVAYGRILALKAELRGPGPG
jgi:beta-N-acetylhexosaminidase